jgi:SH3-like domain-containing protein
MTRIAARLTILAASLLLGAAAANAENPRETPYMASISSGQAMMRTGPGRNFPGTWLYVRRDLPIRVVEIYHDWRRIQDPDGATGWMMVNMLSDQRTAIVRGAEPKPMHEAPDAASPIAFRAAPGVVGRVSRCAGGWCRFDVRGRAGYIRIDQLWGVEPGETIR